MGIRAAFKEDVGATTAEMVYGESIRLPGELLVEGTKTDMSQFVTQLKQKLEQIRPTAPSKHGTMTIFVFKDLVSASHVFVRYDGLKNPCSHHMMVHMK